MMTSVAFMDPTGLQWGSDYDTALQQSEAEDKHVLLSFSGSDWCGNCIRLEKTLFESSEFGVFAKENLVLLNADFPMRKKNKLSEEQTAHNDRLAERYNNKGEFPTVLVLNSSGEVVGRLSHPKETAAEYLKQLGEIVE